MTHFAIASSAPAIICTSLLVEFYNFLLLMYNCAASLLGILSSWHTTKVSWNCQYWSSNIKIASSGAYTWVMNYVFLQRSLHMYLINVVSCHHRKFGYIWLKVRCSILMDFTQYMFTYPCRLQLRCQPDGMLMVVIVFWDYVYLH